MTYITAAQVIEEKIIQIEYHLKRTKAMIESLENSTFNSDSNELRSPNMDNDSYLYIDEIDSLNTKEQYIKQTEIYQEQLTLLRSILDRFKENLSQYTSHKMKLNKAIFKSKGPSRGELKEE